jgi:chromosome segregation ATPase|tara:strand:+ start:514 stop:945 length:432 start_codon:yes stop_codon:yes gene_type:complete
MAENTHTDIKVQLESLKKDIENVNSIQGRLDTAIDKLTDVSTCVKSMLAVHEEKIQRQEQIDEVIFDKLKDKQREIDDIHKELKTDIELSEKRLLIELKSLKNDINARVGMLEKYKWLILGASIVIGFTLEGNFSQILQMLSD